MTSPNDVIERLEAGLTELVNQLRTNIDESTPPHLVEWLTLDAQRAEALLPLAREAASLIKTLREERDGLERNRDMWRGQVDRQANTILELRGDLTQAVETEREECAAIAYTGGAVEMPTTDFTTNLDYFWAGAAEARKLVGRLIRARSTQDKT